MDELTRFQRDVDQELKAVAESLGYSIDLREVSGESEAMIELRVDDLDCWIYSDEAEVSGRGANRRYEREDYPDEAGLRDAFLEEVRARLAGGAA